MDEITKETILSCRRLFRFSSAGKVEAVRHNAENNTAHVEGWTLCRAEMPLATPKALFVISNGDCIYETREFPIQRQDVDGYFDLPMSASDSPIGRGFSFLLENITKDQVEGLTFLTVSRNAFVYQLEYQTASAQIEICGNCNMRCPQCPNVRLSGFSRQELNPRDFKLASDVIKRAQFICFDGFGETLLCKELERLLPLIPWFKELRFHTNGVLLKNKIDLLLQHAPPCYMCFVSLDTLLPERYAAYRPGGDLEKILDSMFALKDNRERLGQPYPFIVPNLTVNAQNYEELPAFLDLASCLDKKLEITLPFDPGETTPVPTLDERASALYETMAAKQNFNKIYAAINSLLDAGAARDVQIIFSGFMGGDRPAEQADALGSVVNAKDIRTCPMIDGCAVQSDGKGMLCVWQTRPVFNWKTEGTMDPRKTRRGREVIRAIKEGRIPAECSGSCCPYVGRQRSSEPYEPVAGDFAGGWQIY